MPRPSKQSQFQSLLVNRAAGMRSSLTTSEAALWQHLCSGQLGAAFRRQVPVGRFIADFLAPGIRLIVEVDGAYHHRRTAADARRDAKLARMGYRVLRLESELVCRNVEAATEIIRAAIS